MKPLSLEIAGLNSFRGKQVIEFGALLEDGLFGIFGPTGSGKSTILDAITLALYGRVKRAAGGKSGVINVREKSCSVVFTFEIDADGARTRYTIERVLATGKNDSVSTKRARLVRYEGETPVPIAEKQAEIDARILELLGIEYQEFLRAVVLPQGSFAEFLGLSPRERAAALQRLFGLHELGQRLNARLKAQAEQLRTMRAGLEGRLAELRAYDDDAVAEAEAKLAEAAVHEQAARVAHDDAAARRGTADELWTLLEERAALLAEEASREATEAELAADRARLERSERAAQVSTVIAALERAVERLGESSAELDRAIVAERAAEETAVAARRRHAVVAAAYDADYDRLCDEIGTLEAAARDAAAVEQQEAEAAAAESDRARLRRELDAAETARNEARARIADSETLVTDHTLRLKSLEVSRDELDRLSQLQVVADRLRDRIASRDAHARRLAELIEETATLEASHAELTASDLANGAQLHAAQAELQITRGIIDERTKERATIGERYLRLKGVLGTIIELESQYAEYDRVCVETRATIEKNEAEWRVLEHRFHGVSERRKALEVERLEAQERLQEAYRRLAIATLAPQVRDGEPCPLCGSLDHPTQAHVDMSGHEELAALEAEARRLDGEYIAATDRFTRCGQDMGTLQTAKTHAVEAFERGSQLLVATRRKINNELTAAGENLPLASSDDLKRHLEEILAEGQAVRDRLDAATVRAKELEERLRELGEITTLHTRRCAELGTAIAGKREQQLEARNAISKLESEADELRAIIAERSGGRTPETVERDLERMRESDRTAQHVRDVITNEQQKLGVMRSELATLEASVAEQSNRHAAAESLVCRITSEVAARRGEIARTIDAIRGDGEAEHALTALVEARTSRREQLAREKRESEAQLNEATGDLMVRSAAIEHTRTARDRDEADRKGAEERCATALASAGFAHADEARAACLEPSEQSVLRERIRSIDESLRRLATRLDENTRRVAGRTIDEAELAALREAHADARRVQDEAIGAAAAARRELDRVRAQNVEYHRFQKENAGALERERTVEQLGRFMQGDAFINFLADERLADVCRRASRTLEDLTGGRYAIVSRPDEGFIVRDLANGGIERSPASLSGGETFVVSLSLALALSDTIQLGRAPLEFFFLDEGFGTLDAELLDTVIDTLERLRSRRRTIGLITHVGALRERIPRRLVVTPPSDVHGSIVRYEVA